MLEYIEPSNNQVSLQRVWQEPSRISLCACLFVCPPSPPAPKDTKENHKPKSKPKAQDPKPQTLSMTPRPSIQKHSTQTQKPKTRTETQNHVVLGFGCMGFGVLVCVWAFGLRVGVSGFRFSGFGFVGWRLGLGVEGGSAMGWSSGPIVGRHLETLVPGTHKPRWVEYG